MLNYEAAGNSCAACGFWIQATGDWFCEECGQPTCERCGRVDCVEEVFLCPECFTKEGKMRSKPAIYLAGAMEKAADGGKGWREEITPILTRMGYLVVDPCITESTVADPVGLAEAKCNDFARYKRLAEDIVTFDLDLIEGCAGVFVRIDTPTLKGAGTFGEITFCRRNDIPVYAWIDLPEGKYEVPGWAMGCLTTYAETHEEALALVPPAHHTRGI